MRLPFRFIFNILFFIIAPFFTVSAQSVSGEWYGAGKILREGEFNNYLSELILIQKGNKVTGQFNYFFKNISVRNNISGTYNEASRVLTINVFPLLNYTALNADAADCPMQGWFTLKVSKIESTLTGQLFAQEGYRFTCPPVSCKLVKSTENNQRINPGTEMREIDDEAMVNLPAPLNISLQAPVAIVVDPKVKNLLRRTFDQSNIIEVDSDSIELHLYDNGEVDNDTISLFYNLKPILTNQMLSNKPIILKLPVDTSINEIAMYAENLGSIPPNTALLIVFAAGKRYEVNLTSNYIKNAVIRFRRRPTGQNL